MPELPEVETVRITLAPLIGQRVAKVWSSGKALRLAQPIPFAAIKRASTGNTVSAVRRLGKYLLIDFAGAKHSVLVHLGMSGRLRLVDASTPRAPHTHVVFSLAGKRGPARELRYSDPRRFGQVDVVKQSDPRSHPALSKLGVDPLTETVSGAALYDLYHPRRAPLKALLLDQTLVAGIGNIYASEALHEAGIRPTLPGNKLSKERAAALAKSVRAVLERALSKGGTSLKDFVNADGHKGENSHYLLVYDREGHACPRKGCTGTIRRTVMGQRATFHCPECQKR